MSTSALEPKRHNHAVRFLRNGKACSIVAGVLRMSHCCLHYPLEGALKLGEGPSEGTNIRFGFRRHANFPKPDQDGAADVT